MLTHNHRTLLFSLTLLSNTLVGCEEKGSPGGDAGVDLGADVSTLCNQPSYWTEAPLSSNWPHFPMPRTVEGFGVCDVETTGITTPALPFYGTPPYDVTVGCGRRTFRASGGIWSRTASFDESGTLVSWESGDDAPTYVAGVECASYNFWAVEQTVPACASETTWRCRAGTCPHFLPSNPSTLSDLVSRFSAGPTLAEMDAAASCTIDPSTLPAEPTWGTDFVAIRTEGCGVVSYSLPLGPWMRAVVYDAVSGAPVGATSVENVPPERETETCRDVTVTLGAYPAPDCASNVVRYCSSAAQYALR